MRKTTIIGIVILLLAACKESKPEYAWQYSNGEKVSILSNSYSISGPILRQEITYESSLEHFEVNLNTMRGKYLTKGIFSEDSLLHVSRIYLKDFPIELEIYKLGLGYNDYTYDNEVDFYLEKNNGVFMVRNPHNTSIQRMLIRVTKL